VWVPGCASGEEAYSLAIALLEHGAATEKAVPVKIFATDVHEKAIEAARAGVYSEGIAAEVSSPRLPRFFLRTDRGYEVVKAVRDLCVFARQDVTRDPPISQLDLISCRNVLIYFDPALQSRVLRMFHYALKPGGYLMLGASETVGGFTDLFAPVDRNHHVYARMPTPVRRPSDCSPRALAGTPVAPPPAPPRARPPLTAEEETARDQENRRLEHELQATRAYLQSVIELKDVANEELRAANEEVVSANEDLTTAREELQAANEELTTVNNELNDRIRVARQLGDDLVNLIDSTSIPIVVLGADLCIRRFTPRAERVLSLRPADIGRPVGELRLKIHVPDLEALVQEVLKTLEIRQREVTDETGAWHRLLLRPYRTLDHRIAGVVLMLIDIDALKRRERQLQESRDYAVNIVEAVREPLVLLDGRLRVRTANRLFYQTFQVAPADTEGRLIYELGNGQWNIPRLRTLLEEIVPQNQHLEDFEVEHDFPRLGRRTMLLNARRLTQVGEESGELVLLAIEDVTARRLAEDEVRRLAAIVENSDDAIIGQTLEGTITSWNAGAEAIFGYTAREVVGRSFFLLVPPDRQEELHRTHERIHQGERERSFRTRRLRKDGREIVVSATHSPIRSTAGQIVGISAIDRDVTEQARVEAALAASEAKLRAVVESAVDAIVTIDEGGTIDSVNPAAEKMFGYDAEEMIGHNVQVLMPAPFREEHDGYLARYLRTGEKRVIGVGREVQGRRKDGLTFPVDLAVSELRDQGRRMFTGVIRDISARKQLEREVLEVATLEQRRIGQALHDSTGQELTALGLLAETLAESVEKQAPGAAPLAAKVREGLRRTLAQVRAYARGLVPVDVDARGLPAALAELAARTGEVHGVRCTLECDEALEVADNHTASHLYHIAQEAVTNALRHGRPRQITIRLEGDSKLLALSVHDDGTGLPPEPPDSRGMGLKIMRYRAGLIQARLVIEPAAPTGTVVICTLSGGTAEG
jgi:PAS domain S-box-containing protein